MIAQFILGLASSSKSPADYIEKLRETDAVEINEKIISFAQELFSKASSFASSYRRLEACSGTVYCFETGTIAGVL